MYRIRAPESCDIVRLHLAAALSAGSQCTAPHRTPLHSTVDRKRTRLVAAWPGTVGTAFAACARCDRSKPKPLEYLKSVLDIKQKYAYLVDHALGKNTRSVHRPVPTRQHRWL